MQQVKIDIFSDVLCVWAFGAQARFDQLKRDFGDQVDLHYRFIPIFAATKHKIANGWKDKRGYQGFNRHLLEVTRSWDHVSLHSDLWLHERPASSNNTHLFIKAVQLLEQAGALSRQPQSAHGGRTLFEEFVLQVRIGFFEKNINISRTGELEKIAANHGLPVEKIRELIENGEASAALHLDMEARDRFLVPGSPTLVMNDGRQRLYGNVGYRVIEANVEELLANHQHGEASWC
ncbi:MAG: DsbA family protein [Hyphomicrobiaceae bacterium]|nr:DsbA family protein [Hyphomicrobiaceae bacterium]